MRIVFGTKWARLCLAGLMVAGASAQAEEAPARDWLLFGSQRLWMAAFEANVVDAAVTLPPGSSTPVLRTSAKSITASDLVPITTLGVRVGNFGGFVSVLPQVSTAAAGQVAGGSFRRSEHDIGFSYQLTPNLAMSLIRKWGKFAPVTSSEAQALLGATGVQEGVGTLLGLSASAPLEERLSLFANLGYGPGRFKTSELFGQTVKTKAQYTLAEMGLAYRLLGPGAIRGVNNVSVQMGYRLQVVDFRDAQLPTLALNGTPLATERVKLRASTQGLALGLSAVF